MKRFHNDQTQISINYSHSFLMNNEEPRSAESNLVSNTYQRNALHTHNSDKNPIFQSISPHHSASPKIQQTH